MHDLKKKITEHRMCVLIFCSNLEMFITLRRIKLDITIKVHISVFV